MLSAMFAFLVYRSVASPLTLGYPDNRPVASLRLPARDAGVVLRHGDHPNQSDGSGAREALVYERRGVYYLHYDGAGPSGWQTCLATSRDLIHWEKRDVVLPLGATGFRDAAGACSPWVIREGGWWHMFYLGTPNASPAPHFVSMFPYLTLKARSRSPAGPWEKQYAVIPFATQTNTYFSVTASPGHVVKHQGEFLMFFSAATEDPKVKRTLSISRTKDLNGRWRIDPDPIMPPSEQIENSSLYFEPKNQTWFLFTKHIGVDEQGFEWTDAIWVYWSTDLNRGDVRNTAVVLDGSNCTWSKRCIGMPAVIKVGKRLAIFYDAPGGESVSHMQRDIGLAWLELPLVPPAEARN